VASFFEGVTVQIAAGAPLMRPCRAEARPTFAIFAGTVYQCLELLAGDHDARLAAKLVGSDNGSWECRSLALANLLKPPS
jgi:hypothetical protein